MTVHPKRLAWPYTAADLGLTTTYPSLGLPPTPCLTAISGRFEAPGWVQPNGSTKMGGLDGSHNWGFDQKTVAALETTLAGA